MSKCDLQIIFDRPNRTYHGGEDVTGTVEVQVNRAVRCDGLIVEHFWQTHGRGNTATGPKQSSVVFQGDLQAGQALSYPFRLRAPDGPPTYHGHYLNVDHYVNVRVDIPWAIDPKHKEEYLLLPGHAEYGNLPPGRDQQQRVKQQILKLGLPVGLVMIVAGILALGVLFPCGLILIPLGSLVVFVALRKSLAERRIGKVELRWGSRRVAPGGEVPLELSFTPRQSCALSGITAKLLATERCVSGSGTNKTTHTHKVHEHTVSLAGEGQLTAGRPVQLKTAVAIPETGAFSFRASDNELIWSLEVRIDIPMWPDWTDKQVLTVRPAPVAELVAAEPASPTSLPTAPPSGAEKPAAADAAATAGMTISGSSEITLQQRPAEPPAAEPPKAAPPAAETPPVSAKAGVDSQLREIIARLAAASRYGSQREQIVEQHAEQSFPCAVEIDRIERTYSYVPEQRFRNGRTVTGVISGTDCEVSLQLPEHRNQELDALGAGDVLQADCTLLKWNNIYDRLEMRES